MLFAKKLRDGVRSGAITTSVRIWQRPRVKEGNRYRMEGGRILVTSVREIALSDITEDMATASGFLGKVDLLKTAKHGSGDHIYFIRFAYEDENQQPH